jgi:hypothetical protein
MCECAVTGGVCLQVAMPVAMVADARSSTRGFTVVSLHIVGRSERLFAHPYDVAMTRGLSFRTKGIKNDASGNNGL